MLRIIPPIPVETRSIHGPIKRPPELPGEPDLLRLVLAGGKGARLQPLTNGRAKPVVPVGGGFRLIDFVMSNFANSGLKDIGVLTQFKNGPLLQHLRQSWSSQTAIVTALPNQIYRGELWYRGTADAVYQNRSFIESSGAKHIAVFGADHVYRMDVGQMLDSHRLNQAAVTVSALPVPVDQARRFGTIEVDREWRIVGFHEKVSSPPQIPGWPGWAFASMGNYVFESDVLLERLREDAADPNSTHDFGRDVLPRMLKKYRVYGYDFRTNRVPGEAFEHSRYWRDVGTIQAYYDANMDTLPSTARVDLFNPRWPMRAGSLVGTRAQAGCNSLFSEGSQLGESSVVDSVVGRNVRIGSGTDIRGSIVMGGCEIGSGARIFRTIIEEGVCLPNGFEVGTRKDDGLFYVSRSGVVTLSTSRLHRRRLRAGTVAA